MNKGKQKLTENYELKDVNDDDNVHSAEEGNHVSDWSTFWGETNPEEANLIKSNWKKSLYLLLQDPTSSQGAFTIHIFITLLIVIAAILTILETIPNFRATDSRIWFGFETAIVALFTIEYFARLAAHSDSWSMLWKWARSFFSLIDLASILPYYIEVALQTDTSNFFHFSILRTFRLLRVFRAFRYSSKLLLTIEVMVLSFKRSADALFALSFLVCTLVAIFATFLYFLERGTWDENLETFINSEGQPSSFDSIPAAAWFVLVTISTVGYGEVTPTTTLGCIITLPLLIFGLLLIALPSFVLGRNFSIVWDTVTHHHANVENTSRKRNYIAVPTTSSTVASYEIPTEPEPIFDSNNPYGSPVNNAAAPSFATTSNTLASNDVNVLQEVKALRQVLDKQSKDVQMLIDSLTNR